MGGHVANMGEMRSTEFWPENMKERDHSGDLGVDGRIILGLRKIGWEDMDWIHVAQDTDQWRAFVNRVMNLRFHKRRGCFCLAD
jgi:hypothetical protein